MGPTPLQKRLPFPDSVALHSALGSSRNPTTSLSIITSRPKKKTKKKTPFIPRRHLISDTDLTRHFCVQHWAMAHYARDAPHVPDANAGTPPPKSSRLSRLFKKFGNRKGKSKPSATEEVAGNTPTQARTTGSSANPSRPGLEHGDSAAADHGATSGEYEQQGNSLWDRAYDALQQEDKQLVKDYEELLLTDVQTEGEQLPCRT
jgi:hypothetical protein